jgi:hypothetical protein
MESYTQVSWELDYEECMLGTCRWWTVEPMQEAMQRLPADKRNVMLCLTFSRLAVDVVGVSQ